MKRRSSYNPKRTIRAGPTDPDMQVRLRELRYGGNPEHKRNPGDFGLTPPSSPRPGKTLCDGALIFSREEALRLLREGARRGLVSEREVNGWPQNLWAVSDNGLPLEAMLENSQTGTYHGYPLQRRDPMFDLVLARWAEAAS